MALPRSAAWRHVGAREGFEVVFVDQDADGVRFCGSTTAVEDGRAWVVRYEIEVDAAWATRSARVERTIDGSTASRRLARGAGGWSVDGKPAPELGDVTDVDLEASALTNAFPLLRRPLVAGDEMDAPAAYVRVGDLGVGVLEQHYARPGSDARYAYHAPAFDFTAELLYDAHGLVVDYPGLAARAA